MEKHDKFVMQEVNLSYLRDLSGGNLSFEKDMIQLFLTQVPADMTILESAFINEDSIKVKEVSHKLKSSVSIVGLSDLVNYLSQIESEARTGVVNYQMQVQFTKIKETLSESYTVLKEILSKSYLQA